jgi:hypothetical protein
VPFDGGPTIETVRPSASGSVQVSGTETLAPARTLRATSGQDGARVTVRLAVAGAESAVPSLALNVNESAPK